MAQTAPDNSSPQKNLVNSLSAPQIKELDEVNTMGNEVEALSTVDNTLFTAKNTTFSSQATWWQKKSIRWKTMILAIAIGTLPTVTLGSIAYWIANRSITEEITAVKKTLAVDVEDQINLFMRERFQDIQMMANLDILSDPQLREQVSSVEKAATLERIQATSNVYNSIGIFNLQGDVIAQTGDKPLGNHLNRGYIQAALKSNSAILSQPRISTSSGIYSVYAAAPIKDRVTGQTIAVIRARMPVAVLAEILQDYTKEGDQYYLLNETGDVFLSSAGNYAIKTLSNTKSATEEQTTDYQAVNIEQVFAGIASRLGSDEPLTISSVKHQQNNTQQFIAFAPSKKVTGFPDLKWQTLITADSNLVFAPQRRLRTIYTLGTLAIAILVGMIAYQLANLATRPILAAANTVAEIGKGNLKARIKIVKGGDEVSQLANNINLMAMQLEEFVQNQQLLARQTDIIKQTAIASSSTFDLETLWELAVTQAREGLGIEVVNFYSFENRQIIAESLASEIKETVGQEIYESTFLEPYLEPSLQPVVLMIDDVSHFDLSDSQLQKFRAWDIKALAIAQIKQQGQPIGLLIAYGGVDFQKWQQSDVDFLTQIANQISLTLDRLNFLQQQQEAQMREKQAKEDLQQRAFELLQQVDRISQGDLTIRAKVTEDEIGTIADSYNATIYSLQKLVTQVKNAACQVEETAGTNQAIIQQLATDAIEQAQSIALTVQQIKKMTKSINHVSQNASLAKNIVRQANETILAGDTAMNQAVVQISALQATVSETEQKAKLLGESSQEISQVVNSISRFAAQTHLLALKASIEAARAGEQGKGFATIADEVRSLANQSAIATTDIENIVARIQLETNELVSAMAQGTEQVSVGTQLVKQTRQSLSQVTTSSQEINQLIADIAQSAEGQSNISQEVSETISKVAISAQTNSQSATQVSLKIEQLLTLANRLQTDIDQFKT